MKHLYIVPAVHRRVRDPILHRTLPHDQPTLVQASMYWLRLIKIGDVVVVDPPQQHEAEPKKRSRTPKAATATVEE